MFLHAIRYALLRMPRTAAAVAARVVPRMSFSSSPAQRTYDVVIVGGGVAGSLLACSLANAPGAGHLSIAVVEGTAPPTLEECAAVDRPDLRVFAITPTSQASLSAVGAWEYIAAVRAPPFKSMCVWDALGPGRIRFDARDACELLGHSGRSELGWIVENRLLLAALHERLTRLAASHRIDLFCPAAVASIRFPPPRPSIVGLPREDSPPSAATPHSLAEVVLSDGRRLSARLVVGADGARSAVRSAAEVGTWGYDYEQRAVVASITTEHPHDTAWQRFLPHGPLAILPLWDSSSSIVWSTTPNHAKALCAMSEAEFVSALNTVLTAPPDVFRSAVAGNAPPSPPPANTSDHRSGAHGSSRGAEGLPNSPSTSSGGDARGPSLYDPARDTMYLNLAGLAAKVVGACSGGAGSPDVAVSPPRVVSSSAPRASFPLALMGAMHYVRPRMALVG